MKKVTLSLLALALAAAACTKQPESGGPAAAGGAPRFKIALIAKSSTNPVFLSARTGAEAAARELSQKHGIAIEVAWLTPPQEDGQIQAQRIAQAVNEGASAILLSCSDAGKVTGAINDAVARGVPVMTFDSDAPESKRFAFYGVPNLRRRVDGAKAEAAKSPGIQIVGVFNHIETPQDAAAEVIKVGNAYPDIQGWAMIGGWPLFTKTLLTDLSADKLKIVSVDGLPAELPYVEKGLAPVLLAQPTYLWGHIGVETIIKKVHLKQDVPTILPMELVRVTKDNLGTWARQLKDWGFTDVPEEYLKLER